MQKNLACCFSDCSYNFTSQCEDNGCSPVYSNVVDADCENIVSQYCLGKNLLDVELVDAWTKPGVHGVPNCVYYLSRKLLRDTPPGFIDVSTEYPPPTLYRNSGIVSSTKDFITALVKNYNDFGYRLGSAPNERTFSPLEGTLLNICRHNPSICTFLNNFCSPYTGDYLTRNIPLANWCGCYMADAEYERYVNEYQVNKACTPYCLRDESVPLPNAAGNAPAFCVQNSCIIDDVTITLQNSTIQGGINFSQVCGNCGAGSSVGNEARCNCLIRGANVSVINSQIAGIDFTQECNDSTSKCFQQVGPISIQVPCETGEEVAKLTQEKINRAYTMRNGQIILLILGVMVIIGVIWFILDSVL